ncbi:hypothetical protein BZJ19_13665 [Salinivibrio proteolyticus]|nr:hypothetical protein BZJ19_13665 [Salinivibrio proteolyticus]
MLIIGKHLVKSVDYNKVLKRADYRGPMCEIKENLIGKTSSAKKWRLCRQNCEKTVVIVGIFIKALGVHCRGTSRFFAMT